MELTSRRIDIGAISRLASGGEGALGGRTWEWHAKLVSLKRCAVSVLVEAGPEIVPHRRRVSCSRSSLHLAPPRQQRTHSVGIESGRYELPQSSSVLHSAVQIESSLVKWLVSGGAAVDFGVIMHRREGQSGAGFTK